MSESVFDSSETTGTIPRDGTTRAFRSGTGRRQRVHSTGPHRRSGTTKHYARKLSDETHSRIGGYRLIDKLGKGGMSVVYRALQIATGRTVALKVVNLEEVKEEGLAEQIFREASALAQINHANVIGCFGFGEDRGRMYMALEMLSGGDSTELVKQDGRLGEQQIIDIALQAVEGFKAIHDAGFVHRDIKPSNIFVSDGVVKIADLGLAWSGSQLDRESRVASMGTPSYMSPEQVTGEHELDFRSDIYSLGASLFFYATGRPPYGGNDVFAVLEAVVNEPVPDVREFNPSISDDLAGIMATMMHKRRERRYLSLEALREDLQRVRNGTGAVHCDHVSKPTQAISVGETRQAQPKGMLLLAAMLGVVCLLLAVVVGLMLLGGDDDAASGDGGDTSRAAPAVSLQEFDLLADPRLDWQRAGAVDVLPGGGMAHCAGGRLTSQQTAAIYDAVVPTGSFTLELVCRPSSLRQVGPARIVSLSFGSSLRNLTLGQQDSGLEFRLRTTATSANGLRPHLISPPGILSGERQHIVVVRDGASHRLYVDGQEVATTEVPGDLTAWDRAYPLLIGDELDGGFAWQGQVFRLRLLNVALDAEGVGERFRDWQSGH